jgi:ABC-2 type transport system permease protein
MKAISIVLKDMQLAFKEPATWVNLFLLPLIFIFVFGGGLGSIGSGAKAEAARLPLPVVNLDAGGELADTLLSRLQTGSPIDVVPMAQADAEVQLESRIIEHMLIIPASFSANFDAGKPVTLQLVSHPSVPLENIELFRLAVDSVAQDLALEQQLIASLEQMGAMQAAAEPEQQVFATERSVAQAQSQFERAQERPLIGVEQMAPGQIMKPEATPAFSDVQIKVPGFAVLFVFLAAQATARSVYDEKKVGSFRRLLAAPLSKAELLFGKMAPNFLTALIQFIVIFAVAIFLLPLLGLEQLDLGRDPLALILLCLLIALCSTSLGILIVSFARTESQIGGLSWVLIWGMSILGGALMPAFLINDFLNALARFVPPYWAIDGFYDLLVLGGGLPDIAPALLALLGFSIVFFSVGLWRFEYN